MSQSMAIYDGGARGRAKPDGDAERFRARGLSWLAGSYSLSSSPDLAAGL